MKEYGLIDFIDEMLTTDFLMDASHLNVGVFSANPKKIKPEKLIVKPKRIHYDFGIEKVIYNKPATIVRWKDGTKTVVKCDEHDTYDPEKGLVIAILKKFCGNKGAFYHDIIVPWLPKSEEVTDD